MPQVSDILHTETANLWCFTDLPIKKEIIKKQLFSVTKLSARDIVLKASTLTNNLVVQILFQFLA